GAARFVVVQGSGDAQALAGFGVATVAVGAFHRDAGSGVTRLAERAEGVVGGADALGARGACAWAGGGIGAGAVRAGCQGAGVRAGTIGIDEALDRGADAAQAGFADAAVGVVAAIAGDADGRARGICAADSPVGA